MSLFLTIVHVIVCFVLILVILLQAGRGQGLSGPAFASGNVQSLFGTGAADFLTKATTVSAICFLFTSIGLGYVETHRSKSLLKFNQQASQMDLDSIKKALERVKNEEKKTPAAAATAVEDTAQKAGAQAQATAAKTVSDVKTATAPAVSEVKTAAATAKDTAAAIKTEAAASAPKKS